MSGGFAGGLAGGITNGMQLYMQNKYYSGLNDYREELNRIREEQAATKASGGTGGKKATSSGDEDGFWNAIAPIFKTDGSGQQGNPAPAQRPVMIDPNFQRMPGYARGGLVTLKPKGYAQGGVLQIPDAAFSGNPAGAYQAGSLASVAPAQAQAPAQPAQPAEQVDPRQEVVKQMLFGNLANEPDKLNAIQAAAVAHGMGDKITPWLEGMYKAKKRGIFDGAMNLLNNNVDGAIDDLKRGGISLQDRPVKVNPDDPNDTRWRINVSGTGERVMDIKNMVASTMDADKFGKWTNDTSDSIGKRNVSDAQVKNLNASAGKNDAMAKAYASGSLGSAARSGGPSKAPRVVKTVETNQGMVAVMSDGSQNILKDADGKPLYGTSGQKTAAGLIGKTLNQYGDNGDIAGKVNSLAGQLQGGRPQAPARINTLPEGAKQIGTSGGKPVYEVGEGANRRRLIGD